jgi:hypothetical protein
MPTRLPTFGSLVAGRLVSDRSPTVQRNVGSSGRPPAGADTRVRYQQLTALATTVTTHDQFPAANKCE